MRYLYLKKGLREVLFQGEVKLKDHVFLGTRKSCLTFLSFSMKQSGEESERFL